MGLIVRLVVVYAVCLATAAHAGGSKPEPQQRRVDVALVLMLDASTSVDEQRWDVQQKSYAAAFRHESVINASISGEHGAIAVLMMHWSGLHQQRIVIPWTIVDTPQASRQLAEKMSKTNRALRGGETFIGDALAHAVAMFGDLRFTPERKVIDISGDGKDTNSKAFAAERGYPLNIARALAIQKGITINGLPILGEEPDVAEFYEEFVIGGPGAFIVVVPDPLDLTQFIRAVQMKLVRELASAR